MAKHSNDGKGGGKAAADAAAKGPSKAETAAAGDGAAGAPQKSWAASHAGTFYIVGAFGLVVLIAVMRASCN